MTDKIGIYEALAKAQSEITAAHKNKEVTVTMKSGGKYKFKYATLDGIIENTLRPVLPKHGIWFTQRIEGGSMITKIIHSGGGELDTGHIPFPNLPNAPQEAGSIVTYYKRYSLCQAFGIMADEDDDANVAEGNGYTPAKAPPPKPRMEPPCSDVDVTRITELAEAAGVSLDVIKESYLVDDIAKLNATQAMKTINNLKKRIDDNGAAK